MLGLVSLCHLRRLPARHRKSPGCVLRQRRLRKTEKPVTCTRTTTARLRTWVRGSGGGGGGGGYGQESEHEGEKGASPASEPGTVLIHDLLALCPKIHPDRDTSQPHASSCHLCMQRQTLYSLKSSPSLSLHLHALKSRDTVACQHTSMAEHGP